MENLSFVGILTLALLGVCSVLVLSVAIERMRLIAKQRVGPEWLLEQLYYFLKDRRYDLALSFARQLPVPAARVVESGLMRHHLQVEDTEAAMAGVVARQKANLEAGLPTLGTIAVIAPFIGLFGTVVGIINTFSDVAEQGQAGIEVVSAGVSEALVATAAGLFVAIAAVVLFNLLKAQIASLVLDMKLVASRLSEMLELLRREQAFPEDLTGGQFEAAKTYEKAVAGQS